MKDIITNEFVYELYDSNKLDHISLIEELSNDYLTNEFFKDYKSIIDKTDSENYFTYIILNRYGLIGLITLTKIKEDTFVLSYIIKPSFRGQKYSSRTKIDFINYLFNTNKASKILCYIDINNIRSINSMMKTNPTKIEKTKDNNLLLVTYEKTKENLLTNK